VKLEVNHEELKQILKVVWKAKLPLFIWGAPGIGKSYMVRDVAKEIAKELGREFVELNKIDKAKRKEIEANPEKYFVLYDIRLSQYDPSDLRGLPALNGQETVEWRINDWVYLFSRPNIAGIIFFDELNLAPPSIQASAYQIILDRCISDTPIAKDVLIVSAGNRLEDKANVFDMPKPLQNRFLHCTLRVPSVEEWTKWAQEHNLDMRVITYLNSRPSHLFKMDEESNDEAFPTPRTVEFWARLIRDVPDEDLNTLEKLTAIAVGTGVALEFVSFIKLRRQIDFKDLLEHPEKLRQIEEVDMKYAIVSLIADYWRNSRKDMKTFAKLFKIIKEFPEAEFQIITLREIRRQSPKILFNALMKVPEYNEWANKIIQYL